jgi:DNA-binding NarL/FixJ family response regulator
MTGEQDRQSRGVLGVLVCDDSEAIRDALRHVIELRRSLCVLGEASNGKEAIVEASRLRPDVILLDLSMPERTGLEIIQDIRQIVPEARIVVFSSFPATVMGAASVGLGATLYVEKGASPDTINDAIEGIESPALASRPCSPSESSSATGVTS